jgi:hypothetical protein
MKNKNHVMAAFRVSDAPTFMYIIGSLIFHGLGYRVDLDQTIHCAVDFSLQILLLSIPDVSSASRGHFDDNNAPRSARLSSNISNNDLLSSESSSQVNPTSVLHDSISRPEHPSALAASSRRSASSNAQSSAPTSNKNASEQIDLMDFLNSGTKDNTGVCNKS